MDGKERVGIDPFARSLLVSSGIEDSNNSFFFFLFVLENRIVEYYFEEDVT